MLSAFSWTCAIFFGYEAVLCLHLRPYSLLPADKEIPTLWDDCKTGRNAALEWVLNYKTD